MYIRMYMCVCAYMRMNICYHFCIVGGGPPFSLSVLLYFVEREKSAQLRSLIGAGTKGIRATFGGLSFSSIDIFIVIMQVNA